MSVVTQVFRVERRDGGLAHLVVDHPARKLNVLDADAVASLEAALTDLESAPPLGVLVISGKPGSFIAGADVDAIGTLTDAAEVHLLVRRGQAAHARLAALPCPTVAAIDGVCLGGGTELALACDSRIATEEPRTQIGLPETMLGILPAWGGTTRLPRLVGLPAALDLILSGRTLDARRAEKLGLIARAVPAAWLVERAETRLAELAKRPKPKRRDRYRPRDLVAWFLHRTPFGRSLVFREARKGVVARTAGVYPAPLAVLSVLERTVARPEAEGFAAEADFAAPLVVGGVCKNLVRIFRLSESAKRANVVADPALKPTAVGRMALIGAGVMGAGIAELASRNGIAVRMREIKPEALQAGLKTVRGLIDERGRKRRMAARERDGQMARILPTLELTGMGHADFALEVVVEDLDVKRRVFAELEVRVPAGALLASNTSSLSINALAQGLLHPERFVGFHFFNPVHRMPLVEVVRGERTSDASLVTAVGLARKLGKTPVVVKDSPGFVVNRVLMPYLREALHLLEEGYTVPDLDLAMRRFGMPMGPFEVVDEVGLDVAAKVAGVLSKAFPDRMLPSPALEKMLAAGKLGRKNGAGFYRHKGRTRKPDRSVRGVLGLSQTRHPHTVDSLAERMVLAMINESARCVEEGIVAGPEEVDLAMVFGAGFPPYRGGVLRHADATGLPAVVDRLRALRAEKGPRFEPCALLVAKAAAGETFTGIGGSPRPAAIEGESLER
ncbi:MAG TPA: 3-hydroxyacyl-CoA dehydrogenase NAD-binding domain-containing protein [Candidatus Eisenbacteria bacterium]|jgi:3-hydroxyacyl-CoA dehydrogenase/enoyl-CoA hydratase/3-hydroxybutyryl-CoA epimerase